MSDTKQNHWLFQMWSRRCYLKMVTECETFEDKVDYKRRKQIKKWSPNTLFKFTPLGRLLSEPQLCSRFFPLCDLGDSVFWCEPPWLTCSLLRRFSPPKFFLHQSVKRLVLRSPLWISLPLLPLPFTWLPPFSLPSSSLPPRFPFSLSMKCWMVGLLFSRRLLWLPFSVTSGKGWGGGTSGPLKDKCGLKVGSLFSIRGLRAGHAHAPWHPFLQ